MALLLDSFWRAVAYCFRPRVILLSLAPLLIMLLVAVLATYFYWDAAVAGMAAWLTSSSVFTTIWGWFAHLGLPDLQRVIAPVLVVMLATPVAVLIALLLAAVLVSPAVLKLVTARRFPDLERRGHGSLLGSVVWSLGQTALALVALVISLPFWLIPPLILILPPLIWGWLTYRVMSHDALETHASPDERRALLKTHRVPLLIVGVICGYLGVAPAIIWASFALFAVAFVALIPIGVWIYTLVFAFSALWFTHYCLAALEAQRSASAAPAAPSPPADGEVDRNAPDGGPLLPLPYER